MYLLRDKLSDIHDCFSWKSTKSVKSCRTREIIVLNVWTKLSGRVNGLNERSNLSSRAFFLFETLRRIIKIIRGGARRYFTYYWKISKAEPVEIVNNVAYGRLLKCTQKVANDRNIRVKRISPRSPDNHYRTTEIETVTYIGWVTKRIVIADKWTTLIFWN